MLLADHLGLPLSPFPPSLSTYSLPLTVSYPRKYPLGEKSTNTEKGVSPLAASCLPSGKSAASSNDKFVTEKNQREIRN